MAIRPAVEQAGSSSKRQKLSGDSSARIAREQTHDEVEEDEIEEDEKATLEAGCSQDEEALVAFSRPDEIFSPPYIQQLRSAFTAPLADNASKSIMNTKNSDIPHATVGTNPFPSLQLHDVFTEELIQEAREQLIKEVSFAPKGNDLYSYRGSGDLSDPDICKAGTPLANLRDALYSDKFTQFLSSVTGVKLFSGRPDLSSHQYWDGDHLLAHDDDVQGEVELDNEGRRIAFILYLVDEEWDKEDGGALDLFECDTLGHPTRVKHSITPAFNSIALFEVTPTSYHTVAEVTLGKKSKRTPPYRLSISGWFHGPLSSRLALPLSTTQFVPFRDMSVKDLVNPTYLDSKTQKTIQTSLINDSSIELRGFLNANIWQKLQDELTTSNYDTSPDAAVGPAHLRNYYRLSGSSIVDQLTTFFKSSDFLSLLSDFTSLDFLPGESKARVGGRLFKQGSYTLLHDQGRDPDGVDILFSLGTKRLRASGRDKQKAKASKGKGKANGMSAEDDGEDSDLEEQGWSSKWGGQTCYCPNRTALAEEGEDEDAEDDSQSTLTIMPGGNTLAIIVRSLHTLKFVKYVNASARDPLDGVPLARCDIEGVYEVDLGEDDEVEGEIVTDDEEEDGNDEHEEWSGITDRNSHSEEADGTDELDN